MKIFNFTWIEMQTTAKQKKKKKGESSYHTFNENGTSRLDKVRFDNHKFVRLASTSKLHITDKGI
jgi:hypothetical protein